MKEHPILFSGAMVRALLDGRKTQTRRVVKGLVGDRMKKPDGWGVTPRGTLIPVEHAVRYCPYGEPGDRLWVRETWGGAFVSSSFDPQECDVDPVYPREWKIPKERPDHFAVSYRADFATKDDAGDGWFPSIHMPRWASRITLELTGVRAERVQDIKPSECFAEGAVGNSGEHPRAQFRTLWDSINAKRGYGWDANPWVWCLSFRVLGGAA